MTAWTEHVRNESASTEPARIAYAPGEAWCVAAGRAVLVCERDLAPARAAALHAQAAAIDTVEALRALVDAEPSALIGLVDLGGSRALLRRHGVPATADGAALPDRYGADWSLDETGAAASVAAGGLAALDGDLLPLEGGVARVAAVRVAPWRADAPADAAQTGQGDEGAEEAHSTGAFGQTLPPREAAEAAEHVAPEPQAPARAADAVPPITAQGPVTPEPPEEPASSDTGNPIGGLIDSVPGFIQPAADVHGGSAAEPAATAPAAVPASAPAATPVAAPAAAPATASAAAAPIAPATAPTAAALPDVPAASAPVPAPAPGPADLGDHDGMTVTADRARELLAERGQGEPVAAPATGPLVLSTVCPNGHVNAPGTLQCQRCGAPVDERSAAQRRRPEVAVVVLPSAERVPLGRGVIIGRRPRSRRVEDGRVPRLVTVESPSEDISRSHLELRVEDWNLVAVDLSSTNGTLLLREGAAPQRLRPEASTILQLGDRLDLGDGVVVTIESAP